jgi:2-oxoglutarate ferredoxin oxidoreductase subunit beta
MILNIYVHAIDELGIDIRNIVSVTGIGCSSWIPSPYFRADTLHTTHGRPIAFATGVKIMKPNMKVVVIAGDGDLAGIGGNHLIHAARRNIGITVLLVNNYIYGMTGGQVSPTTPFSHKTTTTPYGNFEAPFDIAQVIDAAGANYVARWTTFHWGELVKTIKEALTKEGFCFIEILSQCPVSYGRRVKKGDGITLLEEYKKNTIHIDKAKNMSEKELEGKIIVGKLSERNRVEFTKLL